MNTLRLFTPVFGNSLFDTLSGSPYNFDVFGRINGGQPAVDVRKTKEAYILEADLPGYTDKDISIHLKERVLTLGSQPVQEVEKTPSNNTTPTNQEDGLPENAVQTGCGQAEIETAPDTQQERFIIRERVRSTFVRRFTLPEDIDTDKIEARFLNGVLSITIPRKAESPRREIVIKAS